MAFVLYYRRDKRTGLFVLCYLNQISLHRNSSYYRIPNGNNFKMILKTQNLISTINSSSVKKSSDQQLY